MKPTYSATLTVEQAQEMVRRELSTPKRLGYLLLLMLTLTAACLISTLWITEPAPLPLRTKVAFGLLTFINLAWSGLCGWIVTRRKILFAQHRVMAGWMALVFCALFSIIGLVVAAIRMNTTALAVVGAVGTCQLLLAILVLKRARYRRRQLLARRDELNAMLRRR
jgi:hypothetical protein